MAQRPTSDLPKKPRNLIGPKPRRQGYTAKHPKPTPAEQDSIAIARNLGRSSLGLAVKRLLEALNAEKVEFVKDDGGFVPVGEIPDHAIRIRAANELCDRFGLPRRTEVDAGDQVSLLLSALSTASKDRRSGP